MRFTEIISEDANPKRQAAIAIAMKKAGKKPKSVAEGKVKLYTDPSYFGAEVDDTGFDNLPIVNISANQLVGFEPDSKMNQPKSRANVEKIVAGLKQGAKLPPLLVRKYKNGYQVLDGHHRFWAYKLLGVKSIPSRIVPDEDIEEISKQGVAEGLTEMDNRTPSGDREEQRRNRPEAKAKQNKEQQNRLKDTSPEMRKKLRLPEPKQGVAEGENWSKHNNKRAGGMSKKSVSVYRREHPGSKIQTAVTTKPSKLKKGSKAAKRRASFCARMRGMKKHRTGAKTAHDPNSNINKSLRRWHCESIEELHELVMLAEQFIRNNKK